MKAKDCVKKLINNYRSLVDQMLYLLKKNVKDRKIDFTNTMERVGVLNDSIYKRHITYKMHGMGCLFKIDNRVVVDIDYARSRYDGIDYWFLVNYFSSCITEYPQIKDKEHLEELLEELVNDQYLIKHQSSYYVQSDFGNPKEFQW